MIKPISQSKNGLASYILTLRKRFRWYLFAQKRLLASSFTQLLIQIEVMHSSCPTQCGNSAFYFFSSSVDNCYELLFRSHPSKVSIWHKISDRLRASSDFDVYLYSLYPSVCRNHIMFCNWSVPICIGYAERY